MECQQKKYYIQIATTVWHEYLMMLPFLIICVIFFVNSYSDQKIFVLFVTSKNIVGSFGTMAEIGAAWITRAEHRIFNINDFTPQKPLNNDMTWHTTHIDEEGNISMDCINADHFCHRIVDICKKLGYDPKDNEINMTYLKSQIEISE